MNLHEKIGQRLMIGFPGLEMDEAFVNLVKKYKIGNVILFRRNVENCAQLKKLCAEIQELVKAETGLPAFIGIDQEGGCVTRLSDDAVNVAGEMALAATGDPENARLAAILTSNELHAVGVNFNFAPSVDVNNNPDNPIIGVRGFSDTPEMVSKYGAANIKGYLESDMLVTAKHFPGHGDTAQDSHVSLPIVDKSYDELKKMELAPFKTMAEVGCPAIMTTHVVFPQVEPQKLPSTMSRIMITDILKGEMGFEGLVVSDCMEMDAVKEYFGTAKGVVAALGAGVDITLVSHTAALQEESFLAVEKAVEEGKLSMEEMDASVEKIIEFKKRYCVEAEGVWGQPEAQSQSLEIRARTITVASGEIPALGENPIFMGCPLFQSGLVSNPEAVAYTFPGYMAAKLGGEFHLTSGEPTAEEIAAAVEKAAGHSSLFVCTYNGHIHKAQLELVKALGELNIPMAVVALRNPYDLKYVPAHAAAVAAWDYTPMTLEVLAPVLGGEKKATGVMPIKL